MKQKINQKKVQNNIPIEQKWSQDLSKHLKLKTNKEILTNLKKKKKIKLKKEKEFFWYKKKSKKLEKNWLLYYRKFNKYY